MNFLKPPGPVQSCTSLFHLYIKWKSKHPKWCMLFYENAHAVSQASFIQPSSVVRACKIKGPSRKSTSGPYHKPESRPKLNIWHFNIIFPLTSTHVIVVSSLQVSSLKCLYLDREPKSEIECLGTRVCAKGALYPYCLHLLSLLFLSFTEISKSLSLWQNRCSVQKEPPTSPKMRYVLPSQGYQAKKSQIARYRSNTSRTDQSRG